MNERLEIEEDEFLDDEKREEDPVSASSPFTSPL